MCSFISPIPLCWAGGQVLQCGLDLFVAPPHLTFLRHTPLNCFQLWHWIPNLFEIWWTVHIVKTSGGARACFTTWWTKGANSLASGFYHICEWAIKETLAHSNWQARIKVKFELSTQLTAQDYRVTIKYSVCYSILKRSKPGTEVLSLKGFLLHSLNLEISSILSWLHNFLLLPNIVATLYDPINEQLLTKPHDWHWVAGHNQRHMAASLTTPRPSL